MNEENLVSNDFTTKKNFTIFIKNFKTPNVLESSINKYFSLFSKLEIALKKNRGVYQINPIFFFKGTEESRHKLIRTNLEEPNKDLIDQERHRLLSKKNGL
jgi:hypothetical protein